jgi:hypothetical protein
VSSAKPDNIFRKTFEEIWHAEYLAVSVSHCEPQASLQNTAEPIVSRKLLSKTPLNPLSPASFSPEHR